MFVITFKNGILIDLIETYLHEKTDILNTC